MKNDPRRMATPGTKAANTMAQIDLVYPSRALHGPLVHSKYDSIPLLRDGTGPG